MRRWMWMGGLVAITWAACGGDTAATDDDDDGGSSGGTTMGTGGSSSNGSGVTSGNGGGASSGSGGSAPVPIEVCLAPCNTPTDCAVPNAPAFDVDNYACDEGACRYTGCNSDAECMSQGNFVCRDQFGFATCVQGCSVPADCGTPSNPAFDADNYTCDNGACIYAGCNSNAECQASLGADHVCADLGGQITGCIQTCATPADCDLGQPANDADNYACEDGRCAYQGCNSDAECMMQGNLVCR